MEEQLSEARLECSRLKTELVSEKSAWEITKSEMTSSINKVSFIWDVCIIKNNSFKYFSWKKNDC